MNDNNELNALLENLFSSVKNSYDISGMIRDIKEKREDKFYQSYVKDCGCDGGIILKDNKAVCRWCCKTFAEAGVINHKDSHFQKINNASN